MSISTKKIMSELEKQNQQARKNILSSHFTKQVISTEAWKYIEQELKEHAKYTGGIVDIEHTGNGILNSAAGIFNQYTQMQKNMQHYNFIDGKHIVNNYTGMPDRRGKIWLHMVLSPVRAIWSGGDFHPHNYYPVPLYITGQCSNANYPESTDGRLSNLWPPYKPPFPVQPGAIKVGKLLKFVSLCHSNQMADFFKKLKPHSIEYRKRSDLQVKDIPLYNRIVEDFSNAPVLKDIVAALDKFKKQLKSKDYYLLEIAAIAFYHSLLTYDKNQFLRSVLQYKFTNKEDGTDKESKIENAVKLFIEELQVVILEYIDIDSLNEPNKMDSYYKRLFTHPPKALFKDE